MVPPSKKWLHMQRVVHYARTGSYLESVKQEEKSGIRKLASKCVVEGKSLQRQYIQVSLLTGVVTNH